jgi:hypothetical protein
MARVVALVVVAAAAARFVHDFFQKQELLVGECSADLVEQTMALCYCY